MTRWVRSFDSTSSMWPRIPHMIQRLCSYKYVLVLVDGICGSRAHLLIRHQEKGRFLGWYPFGLGGHHNSMAPAVASTGWGSRELSGGLVSSPLLAAGPDISSCNEWEHWLETWRGQINDWWLSLSKQQAEELKPCAASLEAELQLRVRKSGFFNCQYWMAIKQMALAVAQGAKGKGKGPGGPGGGGGGGPGGTPPPLTDSPSEGMSCRRIIDEISHTLPKVCRPLLFEPFHPLPLTPTPYPSNLPPLIAPPLCHTLTKVTIVKIHLP